MRGLALIEGVRAVKVGFPNVGDAVAIGVDMSAPDGVNAGEEGVRVGTTAGRIVHPGDGRLTEGGDVLGSDTPFRGRTEGFAQGEVLEVDVEALAGRSRGADGEGRGMGDVVHSDTGDGGGSGAGQEKVGVGNRLLPCQRGGQPVAAVPISFTRC